MAHDALAQGSADADAVARFTAKLAKDHKWAIDRWGAEKYAEGDLIPRGIITTEQEFEAFLAAARGDVALEASTIQAARDARAVDILKAGLELSNQIIGEPEHDEIMAAVSAVVIRVRLKGFDSRSVARRKAAQAGRPAPTFERDEQIREKVRGFFVDEPAALSLVLEHHGLFFAVDRELTVSQPFATKIAAQSMSDQMSKELA